MPGLGAPLTHFVGRGEHAIHRARGAEVRLLLEQRGMDLGGRLVDEPRAVQHVEHRLALGRAQRARRPRISRRAPTSPGFLHASTALRMRSRYAAEKRRRWTVAGTSGSGARAGVVVAGPGPPVALRAPSTPGPATTSLSTASGMRVISPISPAPTLISLGRLSHRLLAQGARRRQSRGPGHRGRHVDPGGTERLGTPVGRHQLVEPAVFRCGMTRFVGRLGTSPLIINIRY